MTQPHHAPTIPKSLRPLYFNGVYSQIMDSLTTGAILVGLALHLGASHFTIGLIGALPFIANLLQLPAIFLVDRLRDRRRIVVVSSVIGRSFLLSVAAVPLLAPSPAALHLLVAAMAVRYSFGAITTCAWNSWLRDIVDPPLLGRFLAYRMTLMTAAAVAVGLAAAAMLDRWDAQPEQLWIYAGLFVLGGVSGVVGAHYTSMAPDAPMADTEVDAMERTIRPARLLEPFRDANFRRLMSFLATWNFAANLATPFFVAYMLTRLGYELTFVILLTLFSQAVTAVSLRLWGRYADRFSHKAVMGTCCTLFVAALFGWTFTTFPEPHAWTTGLLFALHGAMGLALAGINLTTSSLALKLAAPREATSYLAVNSMVSSVAAGTAPLIGGLLADFFAERELSLVLRWTSAAGTRDVNTLHIGHWDFFFLIAFVVGLFALNRLALVQESGREPPGAMLRELMTDTGQALRTMTSVDGLRDAVTAPLLLAFNLARSSRDEPRERPRRDLPPED